MLPRLGLVLGLILSGSIACKSSDGAVVSSVTPNSSLANGGVTVVIEGSGFGGSPSVRFGDIEAKIVSATDGRIEAVVPRAHAGAVDVVVSDGRLANGFSYRALPFGRSDVSIAKFRGFAVSGGAATMADLDGDGKQEILQSAHDEGVWIYSGSKLVRVSAASDDPMIPTPDVTSVATGDFDGDGKLDLFLGTSGATKSQIQLGDGGLAFHPSEGAFPSLYGTAQRALVIDFDGDGDLDLVTVGSANTKEGAPQIALFANDGHAEFSDVTEKYLIGRSFAASSVISGDVDKDGDIDLFFATQAEPCRIYLNDGTGHFQRSGADALPTDSAPKAGVPAFGDMDGDGDLDLFLPTATQDHLYFNDGTGHFTDVTSLHLGPETAEGTSALMADFDLDGFLDVVVVERPGRLRAYRNDGKGRLFDYSGDLVGGDDSLVNVDAVLGDFDGDGADDLFVSREGLARPGLFLNALGTDRDGDGVPDRFDMCSDIADPAQANVDSLPFRCSSAADCKAATGCELRDFETGAYLICPQPSTFTEAEAACVARGGHLTSASSAEENAFLFANGAADHWIGYTDEGSEGMFHWLSGDGSYTNWGEGQPDNASGAENCVTITASGKWNDAPCANKVGYVCKTPRSRAPDPGDKCDACLSKYEPESDPVSEELVGKCGM